MPKIARRIIFLVFFLTLIIYPFCPAWAIDKIDKLFEEVPVVEKKVIELPVVTYQSQDLRDPFQSIIVSKVKTPVVAADKKEPLPDLSNLKVQGIIWGGRIVQALIDNKVYAVGDKLEGGEITSIDKNEIVLDFSGQVVNLSVAQARASVKEK